MAKREITPEESVAISEVEEQLTTILGADASPILKRLSDLRNGVGFIEDPVGLYFEPVGTPYFFDETERYDPDKLTNPEWEIIGKPVHDWQVYIPDGLIERWGSLSQETKEVAYYMAQEQADREIWD